MATVVELNTIYGLEDAQDMLEVLSVDRINEHNDVVLLNAIRKAERDAAKVR